MKLNEIIAYLAIGVIGFAVAFIFYMEVVLKKIKAFIKILKHGKETANKKAEETKKAGHINSRGRW